MAPFNANRIEYGCVLQENDANSDGLSTITELEQYGENVSSSLLYLALEAAGIRDAHADHCASHIGKAAGIVTAIRGMAVHATFEQSYIPRDVLHAHGLSALDVVRYMRSSALATPPSQQQQQQQQQASDASAPFTPAELTTQRSRVQDAVLQLASVAQAHLDHLKEIASGVPAGAAAPLLFAVSVDCGLRCRTCVGVVSPAVCLVSSLAGSNPAIFGSTGSRRLRSCSSVTAYQGLSRLAAIPTEAHSQGHLLLRQDNPDAKTETNAFTPTPALPSSCC
jgi:hypothetical protein